MAVSVCPHCQNRSFELQEAPLSGIHHKLLFVQCASCGAPFGAVETRDASMALGEDLRLQNIEKQLTSISHAVGHIGRIVGEMANQRTI